MTNKLIILAVSALMLIGFVSCKTTVNENETPRKIVVTGSAEMEIIPNEIYMTFTLKEYLNKSRKKVKLESIKANFKTLCKEVEISDEDISISSYTGNERWDYYWYKRRRKEPDFMSSISYVIKVSSVDKLDKIVSGLNEESIDNFYINKTSHSDIEKFRKDVKTKALIATKDKANYLAESIDEEIGEAILIQEIENTYNSYYNLSNSNLVSQAVINTAENSSSGSNFQKMKLRYEMKAEFKLK